VIDGIVINYADSEWLLGIEEVLNILRIEDPWHYRVVMRRVRCITQLLDSETTGRPLKSQARWSGAYFDTYTSEERAYIGPRRYAADLVGFATSIEVIERFGLYAAWTSRWRHFNRIGRMVARAELSCCEKLHCEMKHIYNIQRWMRNN